MLSQLGDEEPIKAHPSMNPETDDASNRIQVQMNFNLRCFPVDFPFDSFSILIAILILNFVTLSLCHFVRWSVSVQRYRIWT